MTTWLPELCFLANSYVIFVFSQAMAKGKHFFKLFFFLSSHREKKDKWKKHFSPYSITLTFVKLVYFYLF